MRSITKVLAAITAAGLIAAACAADTDDAEWTPGAGESPTGSPAATAPGDGSPSPGDGSPSPGDGSPSPGDGSPSPGVGSPSPDVGSPSPDVGSPSPGVGSPSPGIGTGASPTPATAGELEATAVVDVGGTLTVLEGGRCTISNPGTVGTPTGTPGEGSMLDVIFDDTVAAAGSLTLSIRLARGLGEPGTASPSPGTGSPSPGASPALTSEDVLPFTVLAENVQLSGQLNGQDLGQPEVLTGTVAPNGLSGYVVAQTQQGDPLLINFLCSGTQGTPGAQPTGSPGAAESPGTGNPSPTP
ncbi:MAG: hypothetical protein M3N29_09810 [Chloroflexota bacterium]|nr:hypothetical protein [Chloroflexota bacterium]